ncbi:MAG: hypothetical protein QM800_06520 [Paludibacter sp.]
MRTTTAVTLGGAIALCLAISTVRAQMRELPKEGLESEGITSDIMRYEPENEFRRAQCARDNFAGAQGHSARLH